MTQSTPSSRSLVRLFTLFVALAALALTEDRLQSQASSPCGVGINAIVCENLKPGDPQAVWDADPGDPSIEGFATDISVDQGGVVQFKVKTDATNYRLDIYRMGYYGGMGARKVASVTPIAALPQTQPACLSDPATGLIDCGNWAVSARWQVPADAVSGIYFARAVRINAGVDGGSSHIFFIVRDDDGRSDVMFQTSDTTWQAYNNYGGNSLYVGAPAGRSYKVSYNRPFRTRSYGGGHSWVFNSEYPMVRWLEANGYDVSYTTGVDTDRRGLELLEHKVFLSVGHDEYWSATQRTNVEAARNAGVSLAFFSGNEVFWKTRWETSIDGSGTTHRTLVCYKETSSGGKVDPSPVWTGTWRDPRFSPPSDGGRPENALTGTLFMVNAMRTDSITVSAAEGAMRFWRNTSVASLAPGQIATLPAGILGYEWDEAPNNAFTPAGLVRLSSTTLDVSPSYLLDYGSSYGSGVATHSLTLYRHASGALVFGAGTVQWSWGLDAAHDRSGPPADQRVQQATVNLLADMGAQPGSLQAGLTGASPSVDATAPTSAITSPAAGATVQAGQAVTIRGTAQDQGGVLGAVEVSVDGGTTWRAASGHANWTYTWTPVSSGSTARTVTILSRATDDSGNIETPGSGVSVTVMPVGGLVAAYGFNEASGTAVTDISGNGNGGTISGATWTTGRFGQGLAFDGINDWVTVNDHNSLDLTNQMTLEAWINPSSINGWQTALLKESASGLAYALYVNEASPRPALTIRIASDVTVPGAIQLPLSTWSHLAATYDGAVARLYVNGTLVSSSPVSGNMVTTTGPLRIGGNGVWGEYARGTIDEVRIYRRALTAEEIQLDMNTPVGGQPAPDTTPPAVSISAPAAGATVVGTTTVSASATDNIGVAGVQFLLNGAPLGAEDTAAPYDITWNTTAVSDGVHRLAARARDTTGNMATSPEVSITVANSPDSTPPQVSMTAPVAGATASGSITLTADASDNVAVAGVVFLVDGVQVGQEDVAAPFQLSWDTTTTPNGSHSVTARARDGRGNTSTSAAVTFTVSNAAPPPPAGLVAAWGFDDASGTIAQDASGNGHSGTISGATWVAGGRFGQALQFNGTSNLVTVPDAAALDLTTGMTVEAWVNPSTLSGWRTAVLKETATGLAYALYAHNNAPYPAATIQVGTTEPTAPGTAALPLNTWTHVAATYDGAILRLFVNGVESGSVTASGSLVAGTGPLGIGGNTVWGEYFAGLIDEVRLYSRALTASEIQTDMARPVSGPAGPDTTAPNVSITAPANGTTVAASTTVTATASDSVGVVGVQFLLDGAPLGAEDTSSPYSTTWDTRTGSDGPHTLSARARDAAGNTGMAANVAVTVNNAPDNVAPTVSLTAPASNSTVSGTTTISANASDNVSVAGVVFLVDGAPAGAEDVAAPFQMSWDTFTVANGAHTIAARARDAGGNVATSTEITVNVSNAAPPPPTGLVAAWGFDDGSGGTARDATGNGHTGTIVGATWAAGGRFGRALQFNGTSNLVTVADAAALDLTTGMTLEAWVNPSALTSWRTAMLKETATGLAYALYAHNNAPHPAAQIHVGSAEPTAAGAAVLPLNTWTHLAATYDGTILRLFVNGVESGSIAISGSLIAGTGPLSIGGNTIWGEHFAGLIDEVRIYNRALTAADIQSDMIHAIGGSSDDTTPPAISITAPAPGATVAGTLTLAASASDSSGVTGVEFKVNGTRIGSEDGTAPYQGWWNTGALPNGQHTLTAVAYDAAGNVGTSAPITVTVANPTDVASVGAWSAPFELGFVAVNMVLLHTGGVLMYPGWGEANGMAAVFNPDTGTLTPAPLSSTSSIFCSGHATLADGRVLVAGGWDNVNGIIGLQHGNMFDPVTNAWTRLPDMAQRRWYPSATTLPDGRVLVTSGATTCETCIADVPEIYNPVTNSWTQLTNARLAIPYYPFTFVLPDGTVVDTGASDTATQARRLNVATQAWTTVDSRVTDGSSAAMFLPGKILQSGTASDPSFVLKPAATTTHVLDMTEPSPAWRETAPMAYPRAYNNLTILPDGSVIAVGGGTDTSGRDVSRAVYAAERWSPATETWTTLSSGQTPRLYHSTALLLPDGRVLVAGGGDLSGAPNQTRAEYYSPPYLFRGPRPTVTSAPDEVQYGSAFFVGTPDAASIVSVALIRTGAATHQFDENQRYVPLAFAAAPGGLTLSSPPNANVAPPGHYLLFLVNTAGVPSVARFVRFPAPYEDAQPPSAPASLTASGGVSTAALTWTASTDNLGVAGYDVHRSATAGFAPTAANRIGQPSGTSFTDTGLAAGTYYYLVTARDAAGNISSPSNQASAVVTGDTSPPTASVTSPSAGAIVSGIISVAADAADNVRVVGVQFLLDGTPLGAEDTVAPYAVSWDTRTTSNGDRVLSARARDAAGNTTTAANVNVTVSNVAPPAPSGLVAAYAFDEGAGSTTADATGKAHTGTIAGASWSTAGKNGHALSFDGIDDWVTVADANDLDLTNGMTLEAWVRPAALTSWNTVVLKERPGGLSYGLYANDNNGRPALSIAIGGVDRTARASATLPLNTWTHVAATYDGVTMRVYVNGVQVGTRAQTGSMTVSTGVFRIGGNAVWSEYFSGLIDDVRIYNRALTAAEIQADMTRPVQ